MKLPTAYVAMEFKARELASNVLVAGRLVSSGCRVYLGDHYSVRRLIDCSPSSGGVYLDKGTLPLQEMQSVKSRVSGIVVLDQELSAASPMLERFIPGRFYSGTTSLIDAYLVSGPRLIEMVRRFDAELGDRTTVTGWPRVDLWAPPFSGVYKAESSRLRDEHGAFMLYTSSFGFLSARSVRRAPRYQGNVDEAGVAFDAFRVAIRDLRRWDADDAVPPIIIRPHPSENVGRWRSELSGLKKTQVMLKGELSPWIQASEGVIHPGSTAALEAIVGGKVTYFHHLGDVDRTLSLPARLSDYQVPLGSGTPSEDCVTTDIGVKTSAQEEFSDLVYRPPETASELVRQVLMAHAGKPLMPVESGLGSWRPEAWLRDQRRRLGLMKWEVQWRLGLTDLAPMSQSLPGGISSMDVVAPLEAWGLDGAVSARRLGRALWVLEPTS